MSYIIDLANTVLQPLINLGAAPLMTIILTVIALLFRVKFTKALEGGIKLVIALTGVGEVMNILTGGFSSALGEFVANTGLNLNVTDVGWASLATITWGSPYTLYFMFVVLIINGIMLSLNKKNTLDVDIFDIWYLLLVGFFSIYYVSMFFF